VIAIGLALVLVLAGLYVAGIRAILQVPFRALGILVAGMAFHNVVLMILLRLGTPTTIVRIVQAWKEGILLLLLGLTVRLALTAWRAGRRPRLVFLDWLMGAFTMVVVAYALVPPEIFGVHVTLAQRLIAIRLDLLLPLLYLFGRVFWTSRRADLIWVIGTIVGSAAVVGLLAAVELWLIPTRAWLDAGVNQLSAWLGFTYHGPGGLPENFFQTASEGLLIRRRSPASSGGRSSWPGWVGCWPPYGWSPSPGRVGPARPGWRSPWWWWKSPCSPSCSAASGCSRRPGWWPPPPCSCCTATRRLDR